MLDADERNVCVNCVLPRYIDRMTTTVLPVAAFAALAIPCTTADSTSPFISSLTNCSGTTFAADVSSTPCSSVYDNGHLSILRDGECQGNPVVQVNATYVSTGRVIAGNCSTQIGPPGGGDVHGPLGTSNGQACLPPLIGPLAFPYLSRHSFCSFDNL